MQLEDMVYTDGNILMADSVAELLEAARKMKIPEVLYSKIPFPHIKLDMMSNAKINAMIVTRMSVTEMLYRYYQKNPG